MTSMFDAYSLRPSLPVGGRGTAGGPNAVCGHVGSLGRGSVVVTGRVP